MPPSRPRNPTRKPALHAHWKLAVLFAAFALLLMMPYLHGHWRLADDSYEYMLPAWRFQERALALGQWPHWNVNEGFGKPTAISAGAMFFYPFIPLWGLLVGWSEVSYLYFILLHLAAGAGFAYLFCRRTELSREASVFGALAFAANGYAMGFLSNPCLLFPYLYWPLLGTALVGLHRDPKRPARSIQLLALSLTMIELSGYPLTKLLIYLGTLLTYFGLHRRSLGKLPWKALLTGSGIALLCSSPEWISAFRVLPLSERMGVALYHEYTYASPTNFAAIATLLLPSAFLRRDTFQLGMVWLERSWWVGWLTLAMILAAFRTGTLRFERYKVPALVALGGVLFSMGGHSFVRELSAVLIPLLEHLRWANMGRLVPMVFLVYAGAASLNALQNQPPPSRAHEAAIRKRVSHLWIAFLAAAALAALSLAESGAGSEGLYFDAASSWKLGALHGCFYLLLAYTAYALRWTAFEGRARWPAILVAIQLVSLADAGYAFRHLVSKETREPLKGKEAFALASPQPNERSTRNWLDGDDWIRWDGNLKVLNAYTVPFHKWMKPAYFDPRTQPLASSLASCLDNPEHLPGASNAPSHACAGMNFRIDRHYGNVIELSGTSGSAPAWIVAHDFVHPDWTATLDGAPVPILAAYGYFKAVEVPAGKPWKVRFEYVHPFFPALWWVSVLGFGLLALVPSFQRKRLNSH